MYFQYALDPKSAIHIPVKRVTGVIWIYSRHKSTVFGSLGYIIIDTSRYLRQTIKGKEDCKQILK